MFAEILLEVDGEMKENTPKMTGSSVYGIRIALKHRRSHILRGSTLLKFIVWISPYLVIQTNLSYIC